LGELARLQVDQHEALQDVVVQDEVDAEVPAIHRDPLLATDQAEPPPQLQQECLQLVDQGLFEITFTLDKPIGQTEELQHIRVAQH